MKTIVGEMLGQGKRFGIIISRFNELISKHMLDGAKDTLLRHSVNDQDITVTWVPGAYEIPLMAQLMAKGKKYDAIICLGVVIRGDTPHFDYIASEVAKGIAHVSLNAEKPVIFGVLTVDSIEQALERAGTKAGNKGRSAAENAIEMVNLIKKV